jgi:hypothetical protein
MNLIFEVEQPIRPSGVICFSILVFNNEEILYKAKKKLEKFLSPVVFEANTIPFLKSKDQETKTKIFSYSQRIHRDELPSIERKSLNIAKSLAKEDLGFRIITGYVTEYNLILASIHDDFHKVYLFQGVYAEVIYKFENKKFTNFPTSAPYFSNKEVLYFFTNIREYLIKTKNLGELK